jgi:hypothetical protein
MSSLKQIEANRRNALKSTGPTTPEGKARSSRNAIRHGLTAETVIGGLEDSEDYQAFEASVTADYEAETAVERELVLRLASVLWRLRRATGIETGLFESTTAQPGKSELNNSYLSLVGPTDAPGNNQLHLVTALQSDSDAANDQSLDAKSDIVERFLRLIALPTFPLDRLSRYEHILWRQARQIVFTLESVQCRKRRLLRSNLPFSFRRREPGTAPDEFG